jgi:hypothetical protein
MKNEGGLSDGEGGLQKRNVVVLGAGMNEGEAHDGRATLKF